MSQTYDLVITGGRVIDPETEFDAVRNVGINGDKIAIITEDTIQGKERIDATGHVVAPGFIDMHHHNAGVPFGEKLALRDGVTTPLELEAGVYPVKDWYAALDGKCRTNYGASSGAIPVRENIFHAEYKTKFAGDFVYDALGAPQQSHVTMDWSTQIVTPEQAEQFESMLEDGLRQGAIGVGYAVGYMVGGCTQQESMIAQKLAGKYGQSTFIHARFSSQMPPTSGILGFMELMAPQEVYGGGIVIQHLHAQALKDTMASLEFIDKARAKGLQIIAEIYPYNYGASIVGADYLVPDNYGPNMGRDYKDIIETSTLAPLTKDRYDELMKTEPTTSIMFYNATEEDTYKGLAHPGVVLGSDSFPYTIKASGEIALDWDVDFAAVNGHPRGAGTHARFLRLAREKTIDISLTDAISKMTYMIAQYLQDNGVPQMATKGRMQEGMDADITVFDPKTVTDNSTMQAGGLPSTGIPYVLVNGTVVVKDSETVDDVFPGKAIHGSAKVA